MFHSCMVCCPRELEKSTKQGCKDHILTILKCFKTGLTFNILRDMSKHYENLQSQYVQLYGYKQDCMNSKCLALIKETQERKENEMGLVRVWGKSFFNYIIQLVSNEMVNQFFVFIFYFVLYFKVEL